jgi:tRNA 5-methylaminomethyl-2-thiouridine biosynthesis bifunctional protein
MLKATPDYTFKADCWYLDGFSPNRNPEMWSPDLFREVARLSAEEATFSTFAAASFVRKGLEAAGFEVKKRKGFGKKREMLFGNISKQSLSDTNKRSVQSDSLNWSRSIPSEVRNGEPSTPSHEFDVLVVGAGLAGITTATALAKQGKHVALLDEKEDAVMGASGQSQLVMYAKFPSERNKLFNFVEHCLANSLQHYKSLQLENMSLRHVNQSLQLENKSLQHANESLQLENEFWHPCGVLQLAWNDKEANKQARFNQNIQLPSDFIRSIDKDEAFKKSGIQTQCGGLWFESAGWLDPNNYAKFLLNRGSQYKGAIKRYFGERVLSLSSNEDYSWTAETKHRSFQAKSLVICNSNDAKRFSQLEHLPIKPLRGQVTSIKARNTEQNIKSTQCVLTGEGYLCPAVDDWHHFGATFDLDSTDTSCKQTDNKQNLTNIQQWNPNWLTPHKQDQLNIDDFIVESNAGLRCTTPDYIPIVGQAPIYSDMLETFAKLRVGANSCKHLYGHYYEGLYVNIGHGSKGAFTTPVAADIISQMICGGAPPVNETIRSMLSPARFIIKHLKQRRI